MAPGRSYFEKGLMMVALGTLISTLSAAPKAGYLPRIGPTPLRFQLPPDPTAIVVRLAPLTPLIKETTNLVQNINNLSATNPPVPISPPPVPVIPGPDSSPEVTPGPPPVVVNVTNTVITPVVGGASLTPQMLVPFFMPQSGQGDGSLAPTVTVPIGFDPPPANAVPSSSATYRTPSNSP